MDEVWIAQYESIGGLTYVVGVARSQGGAEKLCEEEEGKALEWVNKTSAGVRWYEAASNEGGYWVTTEKVHE